MPQYDYKCSKCKQVFEVNRGINEKYNGGCPKCDKWWLPFKTKTIRVFNSPAMVYNDDCRPQGLSVLEKRHELGMYWDCPSAKRESAELRKQAKIEGFEWAKKTAEADEKVLATKYKPVSEREALSILKDKNRKQEIHIVKPPTKEEFGI